MDILLKIRLENDKVIELTTREAIDLYIELKKLLHIQDAIPYTPIPYIPVPQHIVPEPYGPCVNPPYYGGPNIA